MVMAQKYQLEGKLDYKIPQLVRYGRVEELTAAKKPKDPPPGGNPNKVKPGSSDTYKSQ
jgi:hypothetical protein